MKISSRLLVSSLIALLFLLAVMKSVLASVSVVSFTVTLSSTGVQVAWTTDTEQNNSGFYVQRSITEDSGYARISDFIASQSVSGSQTSYSFPDDNVTIGQTYYYRLEAVDTAGISSFVSPISITYGVPTATSTATSTATATRTGAAVTRTPTPLVTSTGTLFVTGTSTPEFQLSPTITGTITATVTISPTTTLIPPPIFELEFPTQDQSLLTSIISTPAPVQPVIAQPTPSISLGAISFRLKLLGTIVFLLWLSLASFIVFLVRKTNL